MRKFDTKIQVLKYKVLREVSRNAWNDTLMENLWDIPKAIAPGTKPTMRCCVYKERAILGQRVKMAMGGDKSNPNVIEIIDIACDECPVGGYEITEACRGCLAHHCDEICKRGAIYYDHNQKAHIDKSKCIECGQCAKVCPYSAVINHRRPCEKACKVKAISMSETKAAYIDNNKCISCGACIYQCPFGAITEKSFILDVIDLIKNSENNTKYKVNAVIAPAIASQFTYAKIGQVIKGIKELGFAKVVEAAWGADIVAVDECKELVEKGFLVSSCCPAFVDYVNKQFPKTTKDISHTLSPVATIGKYIKDNDENTKVVFIGPCTAKKMEFRKESVKPYIDSVITFEELQALFDSKDIDISLLEEEKIDNASYFGRKFARSGGLSDAIRQGLYENNMETFVYKPVTCNGIEECKMALLRATKGKLDGNFIEGMACVGGCIGGAGCLTHGINKSEEVDKFSLDASAKTILSSINKL